MPGRLSRDGVRSSRTLRHPGAAAFFLISSLIWSFPLVTRISTHLPGDGLGDNAAFLWNFWWMRHALSTAGAHGFQTFFQTDHIFAPFGADLTLHTHTALPAFLGRDDPSSALTGRGAERRHPGGALAERLRRVSPRVRSHPRLPGGDPRRTGFWRVAVPVAAPAGTLQSDSRLGHSAVPAVSVRGLRPPGAAFEAAPVGGPSFAAVWRWSRRPRAAATAYTDYYYFVFCRVLTVGIVGVGALPLQFVGVTVSSLPRARSCSRSHLRVDRGRRR